ncbi:hypothetical protein [Actinacidiphila oryziradicis]|jgi:hypothetical protein|uniref:hypothetical protein n=1 Tax=Actinacidiphila oryziradicis TaxID=2571141 RepID=UPI0023F525C8|nr:hypothetical protein [Actinacidiphila oryziradicis]MCW2870255.1 hypothetical protein [Actinacidiphila oryziradicis]
MSEISDAAFIQPEDRDFSFLDPDAALTPAEVDRHMKMLNNELARAQMALRRVRYKEIRDYKEFCDARSPLLLEADCPVVSKSAGVTVAQRDEWIQERLPALWWTFQASKLVRISAEDYNTRLARQVRCIQSINANARQAYDIGGRHS